MTKETYVLVLFRDNWADEFDVEGFALYENEVWESYIRALDTVVFPQEATFGTNEGITYQSKEDLMSNYKVIKISKQAHDGLKRFFGIASYNHEFGIFISFIYDLRLQMPQEKESFR